MNLPTPYMEFDREQWSSLRNSTPLLLTEQELEEIKGLNTDISLEEVEKIYLPLTRLLTYYIQSTFELQEKAQSFLQRKAQKVPFVIGIAGSVAVGKSTLARVLQILLARLGQKRKVDLVTTDGFLYPNRVLEEKGIMNKKGFPESYDTKRLISFMTEVKAGKQGIKAPVYSHLEYDIVPDQYQRIDHPEVLIVEGINVLQVNTEHEVFVSDFFDFSLYVDAEEADIQRWYIERFSMLRKAAFQDPRSYFTSYAHLSDQEAIAIATQIWEEINQKNLHENILPTRSRAHLILEKGRHHEVQRIHLRKL